jgi:protoporphyrinogen oxidase
MNVLIFGAGMAGIAAAYEISKKLPDARITVIEKAETIGGMLQSVRAGNENLDIFYHHVFEKDKNFLKMVREIGTQDSLVWKTATTAFFDSKKFYNLTSPIDMLFFPLLSVRQRIRLIRFLLKVSKIKDPRKYDEAQAHGWIRENVGSDVFEKFFLPMLRSKFGSDDANVSAAWFIDRIKLRGNRGIKGEKLGYYRGSFRKFLDDVVSRLSNTEIKLGHEIERLVIKGNRITAYEDSEGVHDVDVVISTIPVNFLSELIDHPFAETLLQFRYQGAVCVIVGTKKPLTGYYWTNIMDKSTIGAIVEHTNFQTPQEYGMHLSYLASYPPESSGIWTMNEDEAKALYIEELGKLIDMRDNEILFSHISRSKEAGLVYETGILSRILQEKTPIDNMFIGGMFNSYPDRSIEISIEKGIKCANLAADFLKS